MSDTQTTVSPDPVSTGGFSPAADNAGGATSPPPLVEQAKQHAQRVVDQTQQKAGEVLGQAKDKTKSWAADQKDAVAQGLSDVALAVLQTGENLRQRGPEAYGKYAEVTDHAAQIVDNASEYLRDTSVDQMIGEVERLGKREPVLFLVGAAALGFLAARFLKSSSRSDSGAGTAFNPDRYLPVPIDAPNRDESREGNRGVKANYDTTSAAG